MTEKSTNEEAVAQETGRENGLPLDPSSLYVSGDQLSSLTRIIEATECFLLVDAKTLRIVAVSQAFLSALGYSIKEVIGKDHRFYQGEAGEQSRKSLREALSKKPAALPISEQAIIYDTNEKSRCLLLDWVVDSDRLTELISTPSLSAGVATMLLESKHHCGRNGATSIKPTEKPRWAAYARQERESGGEMARERLLPPEDSEESTSTASNTEVAVPMDALPSPPHRIVLQWKDVEYSATSTRGLIKKSTFTRPILKGISGSVAPGQFLAIMGPTGCGKTTLLNVLAGRVSRGVKGDILVNGETPSASFKHDAAYVLQDDILFGYLTVEQTLLIQARLSLPREMTLSEKKGRMNQVISTLNLTKARETIIGGPLRRGVSGGERKRVNIGNQLLSNPSIIFLDEPTSGLDTSTAYSLMRILKHLSRCGYTVVSTIHQPSSQMYELFDRLMFLVDGHVVYFGDASRSVEYFAMQGLRCPSRYNPADFMMGLILKEELAAKSEIKTQLIDAWHEHGEHAHGTSVESYNDQLAVALAEARSMAKQPHDKKSKRKMKKASWWTQFVVLYGRSSKGAVISFIQPLPIIQIVIISVLVGLIWLQVPNTLATNRERLGALFFIGLFAGGFTPLFNALYSFPPERTIIAREQAEGAYSLSAYYLAKQAAELPFEQIYPLLFLGIAYWMVGLRQRFINFLNMIFIVIATNLASAGLGLMISASVDDLKTATVLSTIVILCMLLTAGFYIPVDRIRVWLNWLRFVSYIKYAYDGLIVNEFGGVFPSVIAENSIIVNSTGVNIAILFGWALAFRTLAFVFLKLYFWRMQRRA